MPIDANALTPAQRLAISRRALVRQLQGGDSRHDEDVAVEGSDTAGYDAPRAQPSLSFAGKGWFSVARRVGERWWRRHPANAVAQLAHPLLQRYAREQPYKLLGIAAGTGVLLVVTKPWRLLSITAMAAAVLKTSDIADLVTTLMHSNTASRKDAP